MKSMFNVRSVMALAILSAAMGGFAPAHAASPTSERAVILRHVTKYVAEEVDDEAKKRTITAKSRLREDLDLDWGTIGAVCSDVEDNFDMDIPDETEQSFKTVGEIVNYIMTHEHTTPAPN